MDFVKMHGAGNDYVYVDVTKTPPPPNLPELARAISDRRTGVGSDGLILIAPSDRGDFRMIMYNADGSEGEMCGNGIRCIGKYVYEHGLTSKKNLEIETKGGKVLLDLHTDHGQVYAVTVAMGAPRPVPSSFHVKADGAAKFVPVEVRAGDRTFAATVVSMGNPHCVVEVPEVDGFPVEQIGPLIEKHPDFPSRVNVEFVKILSRQRVRQRTWERGSGETMACGSGACAVVAALHQADRIADHVAVELRGGTLAIRLTRDGDVFLSGPAVEVFSGRWPT